MNKTRKVEILHKIAHGQTVYVSPEEQRELNKYKVSEYDGNIATKANISAYVTAVDNGTRLSFYDWCANNLRGDRRRKDGKAAAIAASNSEMSAAAVFMGWLVWGMAIYWMLDGKESFGTCAIAGMVVAFILSRCTRKIAGFTLFMLPIILTAIFGM